MQNNNYTLVTGASAGLGKELAIECARRGKHLLLTGLQDENIDVLRKEISSQYHVDVQVYEIDFTRTGAIESLAEELNKKYKLEILINNAGMGGTAAFMDASPDYIDQIVLLNMRALVLLTRLLLPNLKQQKHSYILNIASMASFGPMPFKTVYPASKAFVYSFSRGLGAELKGTGVSVSVAHPGAMKTNAEVTRRIEQHRKLIQATTLSTEKVAKICVRQTLKSDTLIIPGFMNKLSWLVLKLIPIWLKLIIMRTSLQKELRRSEQIIPTI